MYMQGALSPYGSRDFSKRILSNINNKLFTLLKIILKPITVKGSVTDELGLSVIGGSMPQA